MYIRDKTIVESKSIKELRIRYPLDYRCSPYSMERNNFI